MTKLKLKLNKMSEVKPIIVDTIETQEMTLDIVEIVESQGQDLTESVVKVKKPSVTNNK